MIRSTGRLSGRGRRGGRGFCAWRNDHRMRSGKVGGKRIGGRRHEGESTIFAAKNPAGFLP